MTTYFEAIEAFFSVFIRSFAACRAQNVSCASLHEPAALLNSGARRRRLPRHLSRAHLPSTVLRLHASYPAAEAHRHGEHIHFCPSRAFIRRSEVHIRRSEAHIR